MSRTVVVLGAGIGGLTTAARLRELLPDGDRLLVVDRADSGVQGLSLLWLLRGWRVPDEVTVKPELGQRGIDFVQAEVEEIVPADRRVRTTQGEISYDALVIAMGAELSPEALPGLPEALASGSAGHYYTADGATHLHEQLRGFTGGQVCVVVARVPFKCPAAPYEGAMLAADLLAERGLAEASRFDVYTPEPLPMPVAGPVVGKATVAMMGERGIGFHSETAVERVDPGRKELVFGDDRRASFDLLIVVPPHRPPTSVARAGFSEAGWVPVDPRTLTTQAEGVWALGDSSSTTLANGKPLPKAAVFARGQAEAVATGIARHFGYDGPDPWFDGLGHCYMEVGGGLAAMGKGDFLASEGPDVEFHEPTPELHMDKEQEERDWIRTWVGGPTSQ